MKRNEHILRAVGVLAMTLAGGCIELDGPLGQDDDIAESSYPILGGQAEQDYFHPWVARIGACNGVLIHPEWVLTVAHCVDGSIPAIRVGTTDRQTGEPRYQTAVRDIYATQAGVYLHPEYQRNVNFGLPRNDIALIRIRPLQLSRYVQTAALPEAPLVDGAVVQLVSTFGHDDALEPGYLERQSMTVNRTCNTYEGSRCMSSPEASGCPGDSGSGVYRRVAEGNAFPTADTPVRTTVVALASYSQAHDCDTLGMPVGITDVHYYRNWILSTIEASTGRPVALNGTVRLRRAGPGSASPGQLTVGCTDPRGRLVRASAPMDVPGVALGLECNPLLGAVKVTCGTFSGSLGNTRIEDLEWTRGNTTQTIAGSSTYASHAFTGLAGQHLFTCNTKLDGIGLTGGFPRR